MDWMIDWLNDDKIYGRLNDDKIDGRLMIEWMLLMLIINAIDDNFDRR